MVKKKKGEARMDNTMEVMVCGGTQNRERDAQTYLSNRNQVGYMECERESWGEKGGKVGENYRLGDKPGHAGRNKQQKTVRSERK